MVYRSVFMMRVSCGLSRVVLHGWNTSPMTDILLTSRRCPRSCGAVAVVLRAHHVCLSCNNIMYWLAFAVRRVAEVGNAFTSAWVASHRLGELPKHARLWRVAGIRRKLADFADVVLLDA